MFDRFEKFTLLINNIIRSIHKIKSEEMQKFNLKSTHVSCLYYLYREKNKLTAKELCNICNEDKAAISRAIEYLEKNNYVNCESKNEKRYKSPLMLTEKGQALGKLISDKIDQILKLASNGLNEEKRKLFYDCLTLISTNLENFVKEK